MTTTTTTVKAMSLESAKEEIASRETTKIRNKIATIKGIVYNPKKVKFTVTPKIVETFSAYYAVKGELYTVNARYSNNIAYLAADIAKLEEQDELSKAEKARLAMERKEVAESQACYRYFKKVQDNAMTDAFNTIEDVLYNAYVNRFEDGEGWNKAVSDYFTQFDMTCDKTMFAFLDKNMGSKSSNVKNYCDFHVDNMSALAFTKLFLDCILQVMIDKSQLSMKIVKSTLDGSAMARIEELEGVIVVVKPETVEDYKKAFEKIGLAPLSASCKKADYIKVYNIAKKANLFAEVKF